MNQSISSHIPQTETTQRRALDQAHLASPVSLAVVNELLAGLNREQRRAVTHREGPLLVVAGPGTGKTEVITRRAAWLIATKRARPSEVLALTFTDRAADEMQARVDLLVPYGQADAAVHTFHAFGDRVIREYAFELGLTGEPRLIGKAEAIVLLREHLFDLGLERYRPLGDPTRFLAALADLFSRARDEDISPVEYGSFASSLLSEAEQRLSAPDGAVGEAMTALRDEARGHAEIAHAYQVYQSLLEQRGLIDFGDQVHRAVQLLRDRPAVRSALQARFRYILVDEFQDTNPIQLELIRLLGGAQANVTMVGDDDQAIYTFRGAALDNILQLGETFPRLKRVVLRRNYRSRAPILEASRRLIRHNDPVRLEAREGLSKQLTAHRRGARPAPVRQLAFLTVEDEADAVAREIAERIKSGLPPREIAVLVRTHADADPILRSLAMEQVPVQVGGGSRLAGRPEVRELLAFLRAVANPDATVDLYGLATGDPYHLGGPDLSALLEAARRGHRSLWSVLRELIEQPRIIRVSAATRRTVERLVSDLTDAVTQSHDAPAGTVLYEHLKRTGRLAQLAAAETAAAANALNNIARLFEMVQQQSKLLEDDRVPFVVPHLQMLLDLGDDQAASDAADEPAPNAVSVLTVHRAKGLEFGVVYLVGLVDGRFPGRGRPPALTLPVDRIRRRRVEAPEIDAHLAEERRLCYVAMTRARDELILTHAASIAPGRRRRRPSPFIQEALDLPATLAPEPSGLIATALARVERSSATRQPVPMAPRTPEADPEAKEGDRSLSYSQIEDYLTCPLKYRLRHQVGLPTPPHHALTVGNALHQAVAAFHQSQTRGEPLSEEALLGVLTTHWTGEGFLSRAHEEARFAASQEALRRFRTEQLAGDAHAPAAIERPFSVRLGRDRIRGRIDRIDTSEEGVVITDYKSSDVRDPVKATQRARDSLQLSLYALAYEAETGVRPTAVQLHFLESGVVGRIPVEEGRLERAQKKLQEATVGIRAGRFPAKPDMMACGYCPFREICPAQSS